ncbi:MAG: sigma-70 family RNA polymerase sigma factor [Lachnospiraceae bacterium]|nr:sigma-70 family RNA polymerase sigma factor [Lachnospiraceae bacterium]
MSKAEYEKLEDDELFTLNKDGDKYAGEVLLDRYKYIVKMKAASMFILGGEKEDLIQEGMIGLYRAICEYDPGRDASLATFCNLVVTRCLYTAVRDMGRQKHIPLNNFISIYDEDDSLSENGEVNGLGSDINDPEKLVIAQENVEQILEAIEEELSALEKEVLDLRLIGMKNGEIAKVLGRDEKSTDNALTRIRVKLKKRMQKP